MFTEFRWVTPSVSTFQNNFHSTFYTFEYRQVFLVSGGQHHDGRMVALDSTEVLVTGTDSWQLTGPLPFARHGAKSASLANTIFMFGMCRVYIG